jgi:hypothetical protein
VFPRYLVFQGNSERFLKSGADSPENLLGYYEFDGTWDAGNSGATAHADGLHHYDAHLGDWQEGDPTWQGESCRSRCVSTFKKCMRHVCDADLFDILPDAATSVSES